MEILFTILFSVAIGLIVGILSGLLGIGGGTILVAVFNLLYGMPAVMSTATSLFTIIPTSLTGAITHLRGKTCIPLLGIAAGLGGACMSPIGVWLSNISPEWLVIVVAALVIGYSAITMFSKAFKLYQKSKTETKALNDSEPGVGGSTSDSVSGSAVDTASETPADMLQEFKARTSTKRQFIVGFLTGLVAGIASGYVGVGGGFIMVPLFMQILGTPMKLTSGTSLIAVMILAIPGTIMNAIYGNIEWLAGVFIVIGTVPGAAIGSKLLPRVPEVSLRFGFSVLLLFTALMLVVNQMGIF